VKNITRISYIAPILVILLVNFVYIFKGIHNDCFHATDFSIYQQAIFDINFFDNLNPYLTIRNIKIFNDHFDPIIYLATLSTLIFGKNVSTLITFEFLWPLLTIFFIYKIPSDSKENNLKFILLFIFSKGIFTALQFPIHPSTWSCFPLFLLLSEVEKKKLITTFLSVVFLFIFREVFPFAAIFLALALYFDGKKKNGLLILLISILWIVFVYKLRPY
jgi:hypothetical protein